MDLEAEDRMKKEEERQHLFCIPLILYLIDTYMLNFAPGLKIHIYLDYFNISESSCKIVHDVILKENLLQF